jgi:hypothetical protein
VEDVEDLYDVDRGKPKGMTGRQGVQKLGQRLRRGPAIETVKVLAFPVEPKNK